MDRSEQKVLLIGWDAADWEIIRPLIAAGRMPSLERMIRNGCSGTLETQEPPLSPMLWTTIATGKTPAQHGIAGFVEPAPDGLSVRPVSVTSRNCKAVWNILNQNGIPANVIGWWPSHPAEPVNGIYVSNLFTKTSGEMPDIVHPPEFAAAAFRQRVRQEDISMEELLQFVKDARQVDQLRDKHLLNLAALLANCRSIFNVAKTALSSQPSGLTAVYFDTIDQVSHTFMKFRAPQIPGVPDQYFELYKNVVDEIYVYHDRMLGELRAIAGEDTNIILISDHGFHSGSLRPLHLPNDPSAPAIEHSRFGIFCSQGPSFGRATAKGASIKDITPLLLSLFDLPSGRDMCGDAGVFGITDLPGKIESWEMIDGTDGMHPPEMRENAWTSAEAMMQMMELGYIANPANDKHGSVKKVVAESKYNLARSMFAEGKFPESLQYLSEIWPDPVPVYRYGLKYAAALQELGRLQEAKAVLFRVRESCMREILVPELLDALLLSMDGTHADAAKILRELCVRFPHLAHLFFMTGNELSLDGDLAQAEKYFFDALRIDAQHPPSLINLIEVLRLQKKSSPELESRRELITRKKFISFQNTADGLSELDLQETRVLDFRRYQLVIRLFLEQFHKGESIIR